MTEITRKTSYKDAKQIFQDANSSDELRAKAKERMDSIKAWLDKKNSEENSSDSFTPKQSYTPDKVNLDGISTPGDQMDMTIKSAAELTERMLCVFSSVQKVCNNAGITHPATIGMIFNQVCENRRSE